VAYFKAISQHLRGDDSRKTRKFTSISDHTPEIQTPVLLNKKNECYILHNSRLYFSPLKYALVGKPEGKRPLEDWDVDGRMGSECMLGRLAGGCGVDSTGSG
jgi:hypothetical protein